MKTRAYATLFVTIVGALFVLAGFPGTAAGEVGPDGIVAALAALKPGDVLSLSPGIYPGGLVDRKAGTQLAPIVIRAATPGTAIIEGGVKDGLTLTAAHWTTISGLVFEGAGRAGLYLGGSGQVTLDGIVSRNNTYWGCLAGSCSNLTVKNSTFSGSKLEHGFYYSGHSNNGSFWNCDFTGNGKAGLQLNGAGAVPGIHNCSIDSCRMSGNGMQHMAAALNLLTAPGVHVNNCTLTNNLAGGIAVYNGSMDAPAVITNTTVKFAAGTGWRCIGVANLSAASYSGCTLQMGVNKPATQVGASSTLTDGGGNTTLPVATQTQTGAGS